MSGLRGIALAVLAAGALVFAGERQADAAVAGNSFLTYGLYYGGDFTGVIGFNAGGTMTIVTDGGLGTGTYTETGGAISNVQGTVTDFSTFFGGFRATNFQIPILPDLLIGVGVGTNAMVFIGVGP